MSLKSTRTTKLLASAAMSAILLASAALLAAAAPVEIPPGLADTLALASFSPLAPLAPAVLAAEFASARPEGHEDEDDDEGEEAEATPRAKKRAWLGVTLGEWGEEDENQGVRIMDVARNSPADEAGLQDGDLILEVDGEKVLSPRDVVRAVRAAAPGDRIRIVVERDGSERTVTATLSGRSRPTPRVFRYEMPEPPEPPASPEPPVAPRAPRAPRHHRSPDTDELDDDDENIIIERHVIGPSRFYLGVEVHQMSEELRSAMKAPSDRGLLVNRVVSGSGADEGGLRAGDIIVSVEGDAISEVGDIREALSDVNEGDKVTVEVIREGSQRSLDVTVAERPGMKRFRHYSQPKGRAGLFELPEVDQREIERAIEESMKGFHESMRQFHREMANYRKQMIKQQKEVLELKDLPRKIKDMTDTLLLAPQPVVKRTVVHDI